MDIHPGLYQMFGGPDSISRLSGVFRVEGEYYFAIISKANGEIYNDRSGNITTADVLVMRKYLAGILPDSRVVVTSFDVNGDGRISVKDQLVLRKRLAGLA